jgi:hypothetical protein
VEEDMVADQLNNIVQDKASHIPEDMLDPEDPIVDNCVGFIFT